MSEIHHTIKTVLGKEAEARFWAKVQKTASCWLWTGAKNNTGYGSMRIGGRKGKCFVTHRLAYEMFYGRISPGLTLDHLCKVRECVNPYHLEPVTLRENILRGDSPPAQYARQSACKYGHPLRIGPKHRYCYECWLNSRRRWRQRKAMTKAYYANCGA